MDALTKIALALIYSFILPVRLARIALGRDTLQLRRPVNVTSYWIERAAEPDRLSYFSEASVAEGCLALREGTGQRTDRGAARLFTPLLRLIARLHGAPRATAEGKYTPAADREEGIPDEVYTMW